MNSNEIKNVESELWDAADDLRANSKLTAAEYKDPVLGLILLRFAENRYNETLKKIKKKISKNPRTGKKEITKDHFLGEASLYLGGGEVQCSVSSASLIGLRASLSEISGSKPALISLLSSLSGF